MLATSLTHLMSHLLTHGEQRGGGNPYDQLLRYRNCLPITTADTTTSGNVSATAVCRRRGLHVARSATLRESMKRTCDRFSTIVVALFDSATLINR